MKNFVKTVAYLTMEIAAAKISKDNSKFILDFLKGTIDECRDSFLGHTKEYYEYTNKLKNLVTEIEDFKIYSGGLGVLAGDYFKQATDENLPITFISILWKNGYAKQAIKNGTVVDVANCNDNWSNYVTDTGHTVTVKVEGNDINLKIWKCNDGELYLLDADLPENGDYRYLTYNLYGGHPKFTTAPEKERVFQEIILGIGGLKALESLNVTPDFYHFNDGHSIFLVHKLLKNYIDSGMSFDAAISKAKNVCRFTTHTNVPSGNEKHNINELIKYGADCGLTFEQLQKLGYDGKGKTYDYGMTVGALHTCGKINAVAKEHAVQANELWRYIPNTPEIVPITNGVHLGTWQFNDIHEAYINGDLTKIAEIHAIHKRELINYVYLMTDIKLSEDNLLIGFARRATDYKRWNLFAKDPGALEFAIRTFNVQFVFAGKCHSKDSVGRGYIEEIYKLSRKYPNNIVFIEGYDTYIAHKLEGGSDIWLNTPNGLEASGTSGMKAAANGAINFSTPDGWWKEASKHGINGFDIYLTSEKEMKDPKQRDINDCHSLYYFLFNDILPMYTNNKESWTKIMYESIRTAEEYFNTSRMIAEYYEKLYV